MGVQAGFGSEFGGLFGMGIEGGTKWFTGFVSVGYTPIDIYGSTANQNTDFIGISAGIRGMAGGRFFKGYASLSVTPVPTDLGMAYGFTGMFGLRWFLGPYFFLHAGIGISLPVFEVNNQPFDHAAYFAFSLGAGFDFIGR
jgi:hypothetical protein